MSINLLAAPTPALKLYLAIWKKHIYRLPLGLRGRSPLARLEPSCCSEKQSNTTRKHTDQTGCTVSEMGRMMSFSVRQSRLAPELTSENSRRLNFFAWADPVARTNTVHRFRDSSCCLMFTMDDAVRKMLTIPLSAGSLGHNVPLWYDRGYHPPSALCSHSVSNNKKRACHKGALPQCSCVRVLNHIVSAALCMSAKLIEHSARWREISLSHMDCCWTCE